MTGQISIAMFAEGDVPRLEAIRLLDACWSLHREGILDDHEFRAKRYELAANFAERSAQR